MNNIITIDDHHVIRTVFDRVEHDRYELEKNIKDLARAFLSKYPAFKIENINVFDCYCDIKCIVNLQLK
jgi:hypothetical protein